jgi:hypothetical protein
MENFFGPVKGLRLAWILAGHGMILREPSVPANTALVKGNLDPQGNLTET